MNPLAIPPGRLILLICLCGALSGLLGVGPELEVLQTSPGGHAQAFHSWSDQEANHSYSRTAVAPGQRLVRLGLPRLPSGTLFYDPLDAEGEVVIHSAQIRVLGFASSIDLASARRESEVDLQAVSTDEGGLRVAGGQALPPLSLQVPTAIRLIGLLPWLLVGVGVLALCRLWPHPPVISNGTSWALLFLCTCFAVFTYQVIWLGAWLPIWDDWRYFFPGRFSLIDGSGSWLKMAENDTYFLTGQILDWLLIHLTSGEILSMRVFALALLGVFLGCAVWLSITLCGSTAPIVVLAFSLTISGQAYWVLQAIAYHQFLPVLLLFISLVVLVGNPFSPNRRRLSDVMIVAICTTLAGLAYISGPPLFLVFALAFLFGERSSLKSDGWRAYAPVYVMIVCALATLAIQLGMVWSHQGSLLERTHAAATLYPNDPRFWWQQVGIVARAFGVTRSIYGLEVVPYLVSIVAGLALFFFVLKSRPQEERFRLSIGLGLISTAFVYVGLVAAGRAGFLDPSTPWTEMIRITTIRFHFWWPAALLPIPIALALGMLRVPRRVASGFAFLVVGGLVSLKLTHMLILDPKLFAQAKKSEIDGLNCVRLALRDNPDLLDPMLCPSLSPAQIHPALRELRDHRLGLWRTIAQGP